MIRLSIWVSLITIALCVNVFAQDVATNYPTIPQALGGLIHAIFPNLTFTQIESAVATIFLAARILRKVIPDKFQTGKIGDVLKHSALEINPNLLATPPAVAKSTTELIDQTTGAKVEPVQTNQPKV